MTSVRMEAKNWSELPQLIKQYEALIDRDAGGISRIFGYASIIKQHDNEKPQGSKQIPNERSQVHGMEVAMNVLAAGELEFRGTRGRFRKEGDKVIQEGENGKGTRFASVGIYAGLEPATSNDGFADGLNVTVSKDDRRASLIAYMKRELGEPPAGLKLENLFDDDAVSKFAALKGTKEDNFGMYKFQVVDTQTAEGKIVPAVTVSTNEESKFARIGLTSMETAHLILDGQGYKRSMGKNKAGGSALDYFKQNAIGVARELNLKQHRLEAIDIAVEQLADLYVEMHKVFEKKLPSEQEFEAIQALIDKNPEFRTVTTPYFHPNQNVNTRAPVSEEDIQSPDNQMPHTADEKFQRIEQLRNDGKTTRTR